MVYRLKWHLARWFVPKYPLNVDIELSSNCNLKCGFCPHSEDTQDFEKKNMSFYMFKKIIDQIEGKVPALKVNLRGESTLNKDFVKCCEYIKGKFIDIRLNTNGNYPIKLNKTIADTFTHVSFSLDAYNIATYNKIKPGADFYLLAHNGDSLLKMKTQLTLSYVVTEDNKDELDIFKAKNKHLKLFIRPEMKRVKGRAFFGNKIINKRKNCLMPNRRLVVASNGDIYPCCVMWKKPFIVLGNVEKNNLLEVWDHDKSYIDDSCESITDIRNFQIYSSVFNVIKIPFIKEKYKACLNCMSSEAYTWKAQK